MIHTQVLPTITAAGSAGSAVGSAAGSAPVNGDLLAIKVVQAGSPAATTDITLTLTNGATTLTLLTITNSSVASKWYYPRALAQGVDGADLTGWYVLIPMDGYISAAVAQGDPNQTCIVTVRYGEED